MRQNKHVPSFSIYSVGLSTSKMEPLPTSSKHHPPYLRSPHAIDLRGRVLVGGCSSAHDLVLVHLGLATQQKRPHGQSCHIPKTASKEGSVEKLPFTMTYRGWRVLITLPHSLGQHFNCSILFFGGCCPVFTCMSPLWLETHNSLQKEESSSTVKVTRNSRNMRRFTHCPLLTYET